MCGKEDILNPKVAMMLFNAPPISSIISANSAAKPVGSVVCRSVREMERLDAEAVSLAAGRASIALVASTTRVLIEAMAEVNVSAAVLLSDAEDVDVMVEAVESGIENC